MCRKINKDDKKEMELITKIWCDRSIEVHHFVDLDPDQFWRDKHRVKKFQEDTKNVEGYVYEADGEVKGFITWENRSDHIYIFELFAYKSGEGIGPKLLNKVKELGRPNPLTLHVYAYNVSTVKWYLGQGFVIIQPHESNAIKQKTDMLKKAIKELQERGEDDTEKKKELKYKRQQLKYLMICPNYCEQTLIGPQC